MPSVGGTKTTAATGQLAFTIDVPKTTPAMKRRQPLYVSSATAFAQITVSTPPQNGLPAQTQTGTPIACTSVCSGSIAAPAGINNVTLTLQDVNHNALSTGTTPVLIIAGQTNSTRFTLDGIVHSVNLQLLTSTVNAGAAATPLLIINALDADGDVITFNGSYVDGSDNQVLIHLQSSDPAVTISTSTISAPGAAIPLNFSGAATQNGAPVISAVLAAGSLPNVAVGATLSTATLQVQPALGLPISLPAESANNGTTSSNTTFAFSTDGHLGGTTSMFTNGSFTSNSVQVFDPPANGAFTPRFSTGNQSIAGTFFTPQVAVSSPFGSIWGNTTTGIVGVDQNDAAVTIANACPGSGSNGFATSLTLGVAVANNTFVVACGPSNANSPVSQSPVLVTNGTSVAFPSSAAISPSQIAYDARNNGAFVFGETPAQNAQVIEELEANGSVLSSIPVPPGFSRFVSAGARTFYITNTALLDFSTNAVVYTFPVNSSVQFAVASQDGATVYLLLSGGLNSGALVRLTTSSGSALISPRFSLSANALFLSNGVPYIVDQTTQSAYPVLFQ